MCASTLQRACAACGGSLRKLKFLFGSNCTYSFKRPEVPRVVSICITRYGEFLKMFNNNRIIVRYFSLKKGECEGNARNASAVLKVILAIALAVLASTIAPITTASAQSAAVEIGYPAGLKASAANKRLANGKTSNSRKIMKVSYLGRAPYICTPSGFGRTSRCFER